MTLKYTPEHQWLRVDDAAAGMATVGITIHAQDALGDIVYVRCPDVGHVIAKDAIAAVIESVKTAADVFMPASGEIVETNASALTANPALLNTDPMGAGWIFKVRLSDPSQLETLLDEAAYSALTRMP